MLSTDYKVVKVINVILTWVDANCIVITSDLGCCQESLQLLNVTVSPEHTVYQLVDYCKVYLTEIHIKSAEFLPEKQTINIRYMKLITVQKNIAIYTIKLIMVS